MRTFVFSAFFFLFSASGYSQASGEKTGTFSIGEVHTLHSNVLHEDRALNIYLPENFHKDSAYAVMYLLDGSANEDFLHVAGLLQFFNMLYGMPKVILVGIGNIDRRRDFTFHTDEEDLKRDYPTTGHSDLFIRFVEEELQPYIQRTFTTTGQRYLIGQSLGGLVAVEMMFTKPGLFSHYLIVSPSLWWDKGSLLRRAPSLLPNVAGVEYIYLAVGKNEPKEMKKDAGKLKTLLVHNSPVPRMYFHTMKDEDHATILHNALYAAFMDIVTSPR